MDNYVAIVFDDQQKAFQVLHRLWSLNADGSIIVRGAAVVKRDEQGIEVVTKEGDPPGTRTIVGMAAGLIIGAIVAAGALTVVPLVVGTAAGAAAGLTADAVKSGEREQAASETQFILPVGKAAVIAEISEDTTTVVDDVSAQAGGKVYRRTRSTVLTDQWFGDDSNLYLYPFDYEPGVPPPK